jgi:hypothetical protein
MAMNTVGFAGVFHRQRVTPHQIQPTANWLEMRWPDAGFVPAEVVKVMVLS